MVIALLTALAIIILIVIPKQRIRKRIGNALNESINPGEHAPEEPALKSRGDEGINIIETSGNFKTRMSDFKSSLDKLKSAMDERNGVMANLMEAVHAGRGSEDDKEA